MTLGLLDAAAEMRGTVTELLETTSSPVASKPAIRSLIQNRLRSDIDALLAAGVLQFLPETAMHLESGRFQHDEMVARTGGEAVQKRDGSLRGSRETLERLRPLTRSMGITRVANLTGLDRIGIPVAAAFRPNARSLSVSQGKGTDLIAAKVSALMESIEAHHAERMAKPLMLLSYEDMASKYLVVDVGRLPFASPGVFHAGLPILWVEGWDLLNERAAWLPYELVHANYTHPMPTGSGCFNASTNGLASGNHRLEATAHAICEVIERDASTLWYMGTAATQGARGSISGRSMTRGADPSSTCTTRRPSMSPCGRPPRMLALPRSSA